MDDELKHRFFQKKLQELLADSTRPFPVMIFEGERPEMIELVRKFCLFSPHMIQYQIGHRSVFVEERLECQDVIDYGELYGLIFLC